MLLSEDNKTLLFTRKKQYWLSVEFQDEEQLLQILIEITKKLLMDIIPTQVKSATDSQEFFLALLAIT